MAEDKHGFATIRIQAKAGAQQNPFVAAHTQLKDMQTRFHDWLAKPPLAAVDAVVGSVVGFAAGGIAGLMKDVPGSPLLNARNFAVFLGSNAGISSVMERLRGKEDLECNMVAGFGSGVLYSLASGFEGTCQPITYSFYSPALGGYGGPDKAMTAVACGLFCALFQGGLFEVRETLFDLFQECAEEEYYNKTRSMLNNLGLQKYEKNFKKGLLTDTTLPLLTDSALREVKIPPGPRLLILDHIERDSELKASPRGWFL